FDPGLEDPSFGALRGLLAQSPRGHSFRLAQDGEVEDACGRHGGDGGIHVLAYGSASADLGPFLRSLASEAPARGHPQPPPRTGVAADLPARPRCVGRDALLARLVAALVGNGTAPVPVLGPAGIGKSTLCLAAVHDADVAARFGARR